MVKLKRTLGLFDTFSLSLGAIIGAGIFTITGARKQEYKEWFNYSRFHKGINTLPAELYECNVGNLT